MTDERIIKTTITEPIRDKAKEMAEAAHTFFQLTRDVPSNTASVEHFTTNFIGKLIIQKLFNEAGKISAFDFNPSKYGPSKYVDKFEIIERSQARIAEICTYEDNPSCWALIIREGRTKSYAAEYYIANKIKDGVLWTYGYTKLNSMNLEKNPNRFRMGEAAYYQSLNTLQPFDLLLEYADDKEMQTSLFQEKRGNE